MVKYRYTSSFSFFSLSLRSVFLSSSSQWAWLFVLEKIDIINWAGAGLGPVALARNSQARLSDAPNHPRPSRSSRLSPRRQPSFISGGRIFGLICWFRASHVNPINNPFSRRIIIFVSDLKFIRPERLVLRIPNMIGCRCICGE